jgi:hypothetical protein
MQKLLLLETMWKWPGDLSKQMGVELTSFFHFYEQKYAKILILDMWPTLFWTVRNRSENGIYPQTWSFNRQNYDEPVAFVVPYFQTNPCGKHEKKQAFFVWNAYRKQATNINELHEISEYFFSPPLKMGPPEPYLACPTLPTWESNSLKRSRGVSQFQFLVEWVCVSHIFFVL